MTDAIAFDYYARRDNLKPLFRLANALQKKSHEESESCKGLALLFGEIRYGTSGFVLPNSLADLAIHNAGGEVYLVARQIPQGYGWTIHHLE